MIGGEEAACSNGHARAPMSGQYARRLYVSISSAEQPDIPVPRAHLPPPSKGLETMLQDPPQTHPIYSISISFIKKTLGSSTRASNRPQPGAKYTHALVNLVVDLHFACVDITSARYSLTPCSNHHLSLSPTQAHRTLDQPCAHRR